MKLTDLTIKNAKPEDRPYKMSDGHGLYIQVEPNGKKYWRLKYRFLGKEKKISLGIYDQVTLAQARDKAREAKTLLSQGIDPSFARKSGKRRAAIHANNTFKAVALEWHENQSERWSHTKTSKPTTT